MAVNEKLANKGRNEPIVGMRDQGAYTFALQADDKKGPVLLKAGGTLADRSAFESRARDPQLRHG